MSIATDVRERIDQVSSRRRAPRLPDVLSVVLTAAPFWVVGIGYGLTGHLVWGGDQALIGLDAFDVRHLDQAVGPYSRMGWAHPGPAWMVLLAPFYWLFGSTGQGLVAASMIVHGVVAALVVVAAGAGARWQRPLMAVVVLVYVLRMPSIDFVGVWNPFALLFPAMLLVLVAARACAGSLPALATSLVIGSFLVQTHVGTAPLVGLVGLTMAVPLAVRAVRHRLPAPDRAALVRIGVAVAATVVMWIPPVWQQLRAAPGEGNLRMLAAYLLHGDPSAGTHTWREALSATGQLLGAPVYGWPAEPAVVETNRLTAAVIAAVVVTLLGGVAVAVVGRRLGAVTASWAGVLTTVACLAGLLSAHQVTGPLMNYLLLWISVLPAVLLFAAVSVLGRGWRSAPVRMPDRLTSAQTVAWVLTAAGAVLAVAIAVSLHRSADTLTDQPGAAEAAELALKALPAAEDGDPPVFLDIPDVSVWTTATAVALELEQAGHRVSVADTWVYSFGADRASTGDEQWRVVLQPVSPGEGNLPDQVGVVQAANGTDAVIVQRTH
jgi:hypothetical protein